MMEAILYRKLICTVKWTVQDNTYTQLLMEVTGCLPRTIMSVVLAASQVSHLLSRLVTPVPLTQLPQRKPGVERERERERDSTSLHRVQQLRACVKE